MSSLWTPGGEHEVPRDDRPTVSPEHSPESHPPVHSHEDHRADDHQHGDNEQLREELAALEDQLLSTPVEDVLANHCYGIFQLAALHLGQQPPRLDDARLAIDALAAIVEGLGERLGAPGVTLKDGLAQIRLAFVQISGSPGQ